MATRKIVKKATTVPKRIGGETTSVNIKTSSVDPTKEYMAGGVLSSLGGQVHSLSSSSDDLQREVSSNVYDQMMTDPEISKCINVLKISVLGDGVSLLPALPEIHEDFEQAELISDFCSLALRDLEKPLRDTLEQMLDALIYGNKIAEVTYKLDQVRGFEGIKLIPRSIKVKDRRVVRFVVDNKRNIVGFIGIFADNNSYKTDSKVLKLTTGELGTPLIGGQPLLPREKFMVLTIRPKDEDPRGQSFLRSAYNAWNLKCQIWPEYLRYLLVSAIPLLVGVAAPEDSLKDFERDHTGAPKKTTDGKLIQISPVEALKNALIQARNATCVAVKYDTQIKEVGTQGSGTAFYRVIELLDKQMETGILLQTLATSEGVYQSRSSSQIHMSILDILVWWLKGVVTDMLVSDLLRPIVRFNFGEDALELIPRVSLGDTERRNFSSDAAAIGDLFKSGYLQQDQLRETDNILGLSPRTTTDPQQLVQQLQDAGIAIEAQPPPVEQVARIQAGPSGGTVPVPIAPASSASPTKRADSAQASSKSKSSVVRFPASGRVKSKLNKSPKNAELPSTVNIRSGSKEKK